MACRAVLSSGGSVSEFLICSMRDPDNQFFPLLQVLCRTSGSSLGYGFGTVDDEDGELDMSQKLPITEAVA